MIPEERKGEHQHALFCYAMDHAEIRERDERMQHVYQIGMVHTDVMNGHFAQVIFNIGTGALLPAAIGFAAFGFPKLAAVCEGVERTAGEHALTIKALHGSHRTLEDAAEWFRTEPFKEYDEQYWDEYEAGLESRLFDAYELAGLFGEFPEYQRILLKQVWSERRAFGVIGRVIRFGQRLGF